ncbi:hypothetical protein BC2230_21080 [Burkholderia cepacia]
MPLRRKRGAAALSLKAKCKVRVINTPVRTGVFLFVGTQRADPGVPVASARGSEYS